MGKSSAPAAPDYTRMAKEQAKGNLELAQYQTQANRINQYNPYGSLTYTKTATPGTFDQSAYQKAMDAWQASKNQPQQEYHDGGSGPMPTPNSPKPQMSDFMSEGGETWSQNTNLSPEQQQLLDSYNQMQTGLLGRVQDAYKNPLNINSAQDIADKAYSGLTSRLDPQWNQREQAMRTQLANQGIASGTEAYTNAMRDFNTGRNDAYQQANLQAYNLMPQALAMEQSARNQPLAELNYARQGLAPTMPQFGGFAQQSLTPGADLTGAAQSQYGAALGNVNAQNAAQAQTNMGLMSLAAYFLSDERLKTNVKRLGTHPDYGIGIYSYEKLGTPEIGVMAQELEKVRPDAVATHDSGYKMVDYNKV
jgi:hypothetical protein